MRGIRWLAGSGARHLHSDSNTTLSPSAAPSCGWERGSVPAEAEVEPGWPRARGPTQEGPGHPRCPRDACCGPGSEGWCPRTTARLPLGAEPYPSDRRADQCRAGSGPGSQSELCGRCRRGQGAEALEHHGSARLLAGTPPPAEGPALPPGPAGGAGALGCGRGGGGPARVRSEQGGRTWGRTRRPSPQAWGFPRPVLLPVATTPRLSAELGVPGRIR